MEYKQFTDCVDIVGSSCKPFNGKKRYISTGAVDVDHINESDVEIVDYVNRPSRADLIVEPGSVLFAKMQGTKKTLYIDNEKANDIYSTGFYALKAKQGIISDRCLFHLLGSIAFLSQKDKNCSGATQKAITNAGLNKIYVSIPDYQFQKTLSEQLDRISSIIQMRQAELQKLDDLVKARFVEMFGDPLKNDKYLPTVSGEKLFKLSNGKALPNSKKFDTGVPAYGGNGISWYTDEVLCDYDTIIVGRVGFQSGNVHLVKAPLWVTDNAMYISYINSRECDIRYLCALMELIDFTRYQDAGDLKKITQKPFMQMHYLVPPLPLQKQYIAFVAQVDKSRFVVQQALDKAQLLFDSLMQKYFG